MDDWSKTDVIEVKTRLYVENPVVCRLFEDSLRHLQAKIGTATLGHINRSSSIKATVKMPPAVTPYYVVRQKEWELIVHHLINMPYEEQRIFSVTGMGGCGKTQLVSYFLQEKGANYEHVVYVDATSLFSIKADLQAWAQSLGDGYEQAVWEDAIRVLNSDLFKGRWILVFDSADNPRLDLTPYIPQCYHGTVVITSRDRDKGNMSNTFHMELGEMNDDEAFSTLLKAARRHLPLSSREEEKARELVGMLGHLAVALVQAGTYCYQLSVTVQQPFTFAQYALAFTLQRSELMKAGESASLDNYQLGAYAAFELSYKAIPQEAKEFLHFAASFHHSDISLATFAITAAQGCEDPDCNSLVPRPENHSEIVSGLRELLCTDGRWDEVLVHKSIRILRCFSLITASSRANTVFMHLHPLVQAWARDTLLPASKHYQKMALQTITCCVNDRDVQVYRHLIPHVQDLFDEMGPELTHVNEKYAAGIALRHEAIYPKAEELFSDALKRMKQAGVRNKGFWQLSISLASIYRNRMRLPEAEALLLESFELAKETWGKDDQITLRVMESLATTYSKQGRLGEAEKLQIEIFQERKKQLGLDHKETMVASTNLGTVYIFLKKYSEAEKLMLELLPRQTRVLGQDSRDTLLTAGNLATLYIRQQRYNEAEQLALEVLEKWTKLLGNKHITTSLTKENLAIIYFQQGRWDESELLQQEVLEVRRQILGDDHINTISAARVLGSSYVQRERWEDAITVERRLLESERRALGNDHTETIKTMESLSRSYGFLNRHGDAEAILVELLERQERLLGTHHSDTINTIARLGKSYMLQGKIEEGDRTGLEFFLRQGQVLIKKKNWVGAEGMIFELLAQQKRIIGLDHHDIFDTKEALVEIYAAQGKLGAVEAMLLEIRDQRERVQGTHHPDAILAGSSLFSCRLQRVILAENGQVGIQRGKTRGYDQPDGFNAMEYLTHIYRLLDPDGASKMDEMTLKLSEYMAGIDPPDPIRALDYQGKTHVDHQDWSKAEPMMLQVLDMRKMALGTEHVDTIATMETLSTIYSGMRRWTEAEKYAIDVWEQKNRLLGMHHSSTVTASDVLMKTLINQGDGVKIASFLFHMLGSSLTALGKEHYNTQAYGSRLVQTLTLMDLSDAAEDIYDLLQ
ncbi:hypothetical protein M408DRAFT_30035 [Serendipita vermifera MAFF 305830]|uniref:NB-ARC domain-containing protein n=1 Tax=Serendipita vermifera MAFF 305830 TaxID=933852 RepID=A0A0C3ALE6_SERVB|nr:hypothetical protein M408DRAFT_30035 [Serendipita vermifera MAFF 305830]